jgi:hypothetical protein
MDPDRLAELEEERRFLLRSINDLEREHEAGDVDDRDYEALRDGYVARAAGVLREIEDGRAALPGTRRNPKLIVGTIVATLVVAALAGWMVAHFSGQRTNTGQVQLSTADEITDQLAKARVAFSQSDTNTAVGAYKRVLDLDPGNVEATTYAGWLIVTSGVQGEQDSVIQIGIDQLRRAVSLDSTYADAHCLLAAALAQYTSPPDLTDAAPELATCTASDPPALIRNYIDTQVSPLFGATGSTSVTGDSAPAAAPVTAAVTTASTGG